MSRVMVILLKRYRPVCPKFRMHACYSYVKATKRSFVNYVPSGFSIDDSSFLLTFCENLTEKGCFFTLSNSTEVAAFAKDYKTIQYKSKTFKGNLDHLLITNSAKEP